MTKRMCEIHRTGFDQPNTYAVRSSNGDYRLWVKLVLYSRLWARRLAMRPRRQFGIRHLWWFVGITWFPFWQLWEIIWYSVRKSDTKAQSSRSDGKLETTGNHHSLAYKYSSFCSCVCLAVLHRMVVLSPYLLSSNSSFSLSVYSS